MRSVLAGLRQLVIPWGANATQPRVVIGGDIPAALNTFIGTLVSFSTLITAEVAYATATTYWFDVLIELGVGSNEYMRLKGLFDESVPPNGFMFLLEAHYYDENLSESILTIGNTDGETVIEGNPISIDGPVTSADMAPEFDDSTTNLTGATNTSYSPGSTTVGVSFIAPPSGKAMLLLYCQLTLQDIDSTNVRHVYSTLRVGTGSTEGAGTAIQANGRTTPNDADANRVSSPGLVTANGMHSAGTAFFYLTGLTPGNTYNAQEQHRLSGSSGTFNYDVDQRNILYVPLL